MTPSNSLPIAESTADRANQPSAPLAEQAPSALDERLTALYQQAMRVAEQAYAPYSGFRVGAALLLASGEVVTGTNVENVSYGLTICAERSALVQAVSRFGPEIRIEAAAVANLNNAPCPPCGACRQMLAEFILPQAPVVFPVEGGVHSMTFAGLLPMGFAMKLK
jgi:homotetrameric cytidine deaminase